MQPEDPDRLCAIPMHWQAELCPADVGVTLPVSRAPPAESACMHSDIYAREFGANSRSGLLQPDRYSDSTAGCDVWSRAGHADHWFLRQPERERGEESGSEDHNYAPYAGDGGRGPCAAPVFASVPRARQLVSRSG